MYAEPPFSGPSSLKKSPSVCLSPFFPPLLKFWKPDSKSLKKILSIGGEGVGTSDGDDVGLAVGGPGGHPNSVASLLPNLPLPSKITSPPYSKI